MNKCFVQNTDSVSGPIFSEDSVSREMELIEKSPKQYEWLSPTGELFVIELPHTVYPLERILISWLKVSRLGLEKEKMS